MSEEEAIKICKMFIKMLRNSPEEEEPDNWKSAEAIETVLNMLERKNREIKLSNQVIDKRNVENLELVKSCINKDKIIDLMAEQLEGEPIFEDFKPNPIIIENKKEVIKYFKEQVENEN